ncbi:TPA: alpha/beta hydrolase [Pseudomonas putida]|nr:alpha/beta hydrolase [Pseudomonas putida]
MKTFTVLIVPGLRDEVEEHWQTLLAKRLLEARTVPPMGRENFDCSRRVAAIEQPVADIVGPVLLVAHCGGLLHACSLGPDKRMRPVSKARCSHAHRTSHAGWLSDTCIDPGQRMASSAAPKASIPSLIDTSQNDPLGELSRVLQLAQVWGSDTRDLGSVGHLNPASGYGPWPLAEQFIARLGVMH